MMDHLKSKPIPFSRFLTLTILSFSFLLCGNTVADEVPPHMEGSETVEAEDLIDLILEKPDLVIVDARIASDLKEGFIEGAISLPNIETNCDSLSHIIEALETPVALYCNGVKCQRSSESVKIASSCGYTNLYWFRGGIEEWKNKQYPIVQPN